MDTPNPPQKEGHSAKFRIQQRPRAYLFAVAWKSLAIRLLRSTCDLQVSEAKRNLFEFKSVDSPHFCEATLKRSASKEPRRLTEREGRKFCALPEVFDEVFR